MNEDTNEQEMRSKIAERFKLLPKVVQEAILSADVEEHMRELADQHQLHFDQWSSLENEVMLALLGLEPIENLADNIEHEVNVPADIAHVLAQDVSEIIFEPIRAQLESALAVENSTESAAVPGESAVVAEHPVEHPLAELVPAIAPIVPGTPPPPPPEGKAVRAPISESYSAGEASVQRRVIDGDPYRESAA